MRIRTWLFIGTLLLLGQRASLRAAEMSLPSAMIGIDHIPTAVGDLDEASAAYRQLGFSLKPGRLHDNGLRNNHVKFADGAGIELISPTAAPTDALSQHYVDFLKHGDGAAYVALHVRCRETMLRVLHNAGIHYDAATGDLQEPQLDFLFLVTDNRSPTDRPEDFVHANSAFAMAGVWLALNDARRARLQMLLMAFGARLSHEWVFAPTSAMADVFSLQNGRVLVLPQGRQLRHGRPILGAEFRVSTIANAPCHARHDAPRCFVSPSQGHGIWLAFRP